MIRIIVDSAADYTLEELQARSLDLVPLNINIGEESHRDAVDMTKDHLYEILLEGKDYPMTSQPSPQSYVELFEDAKEKGEDVVVITLSSTLSGTFQAANLGKEIAEYDNIHIVDSLSATAGMRLLCEHACDLREQGKSAAEIAEALEALKSRITIVAAVDTLEFLCRGGRVSKAAAAVGELANIKPLITVNREGAVAVIGKALGRNKAIASLVKSVSSMEIDTNFPFYSLYAYGTENTEKLEEKLTATGISITERQQLGATIGVHVGPGAYGAIFIEK